MYQPLADLLRPQSLDDVFGQEHILGKGAVLRRLIDSGKIPNMVFYGPSGTGKTTVANIIAKQTNRTLYKLNATTASTADIKEIVAQLDTFLAPEGVLLYLDEIQYFNKKQQQSLLEFVENGKITLIASTTENPYFYVYNALLSRCTVFEFKPVPREEIAKAVRRAVATLAKERNFTVEFEQEAFDYVCASCAGDVRKSINAVELLCMAKPGQTHIYIDMEMARQAAQGSAVKYDRDSDYHYDLLSAFQKSLRGSDENAALHYLARLLSAGDLASVCRRLLVTAAEDVGLAYPNALIYCKAAVDSALQLGLPEARIPLADAVIMVATAPKSNSGICAIDAAMADVAAGNYSDVPSNIQDAHYEGAKKLGHGQTYIYPHGYENNWVKQQYLPDKLKDTVYYEYGDNKLEQATKAYWDKIKK